MPQKLDLKENFPQNILQFGCELSDVFIKGSVPRLLKDLMVQAYRNLVDILYINYPLEDLLRLGQGDTDERLSIKEYLSNGRSVDWPQASPTALLWVLRHFLGLLPTPLLAKHAQGRKYAWWKFSIHCRLALEHPSDNKNERLVAAIVLEMMRLPRENFDMLCLVMDLFRSLCVYNYGQRERVNKKTVDSLSRYFTASICCRPYRPGNETIIDKQYHPLIKFMIRFWPEIWEICCKLEKDRSPIASAVSSSISLVTSATMHPRPMGINSASTNSNNDNNAHGAIATYADANTQTSEVDCGGLRSDGEGNAAPVSPSDEVVYLKDADCQTDGDVFEVSDENNLLADVADSNENCDAVAELNYGGGDKKIKLLKKISSSSNAACSCTHGRHCSDVEDALRTDANVDASRRSSLSNLSIIGTSKHSEDGDDPACVIRPVGESSTRNQQPSLNIPPPTANFENKNEDGCISTKNLPVYIVTSGNLECLGRDDFTPDGRAAAPSRRQEWMVVDMAVFEELKERFKSERRLHEGYFVKSGGIFNRFKGDEYIYDDEFYSCAKSSFARSRDFAPSSPTATGRDLVMGNVADGVDGSIIVAESEGGALDKFSDTKKWKYCLRFGADYDISDDADDSSNATMKVSQETVENVRRAGKDINDNNNDTTGREASEQIISVVKDKNIWQKKAKEKKLEVSNDAKETRPLPPLPSPSAADGTFATIPVTDNNSSVSHFNRKSLIASRRDPSTAESLEHVAAAPLRSSSSNKSLLSLDKVKARLDFSKIFSSGKKSGTLSTTVCTSAIVTSKKPTTRSFHSFSSRIKYKKMKPLNNHK